MGEKGQGYLGDIISIFLPEYDLTIASASSLMITG